LKYELKKEFFFGDASAQGVEAIFATSLGRGATCRYPNVYVGFEF
jgi:hypothetical protein